MTIRYEILGAPIMLNEDDCDGHEVVDEFEYEMEPTDEDYVDYLLTKMSFKTIMFSTDKRLAFVDGAKSMAYELLNDEAKEEIDDEYDFGEFLRDRYYDKAMRWYRSNK